MYNGLYRTIRAALLGLMYIVVWLFIIGLLFEVCHHTVGR